MGSPLHPLEEGPFIARPEYLDGTETRREVINSALEDCRTAEGTANRVRVAFWVDLYLEHWEDARRSLITEGE